ncbi:MAG: hypothetical protein F6K42_22500 [Leptolyngbya sp. SIO1D8]|nr:hypothetical protein [Leptolyngbya sp. SIO1D8]
MQEASKALDSLSRFNAKWGADWPFIADHSTIPVQQYQFVSCEIPQILASGNNPRTAIQDFFQNAQLEIPQSSKQSCAYLALMAYAALVFRRPYIEADAEKLAATPLVSEQSISFPPELSSFWTLVASQLGIEASTSLTALVYCNFSCEVSDLPLSSDPADEVLVMDQLIEHQRTRLEKSTMHFCNHYKPHSRQVYDDFLKIFLYSEIVGRRIYWWAEKALKAWNLERSPDRVVGSLSAMVRWAIEALNQHLEAQDLPQEALAIAQFTPAIKLVERKSTPGVTGALIPFLDEFFGFTSESSTYLEKVRLSRSFLLKEMAEVLDHCQEACPYQSLYVQMPAEHKKQLDQLKSELWKTMKDWRIFHRNQVGRFLAGGVVSQESTPQIKKFLRTFISNMNERIRSF